MLYLWIRLASNVFHIFKFQKYIIGLSIYLGAMGAGAIHLYPQLLQRLGNTQRSILSDISMHNLLIFASYLLLRAIITCLFWHKKSLISIIGHFGLFLLLTLLTILLQPLLGSRVTGTNALLIIVLATAEERVKYAATFKNRTKYAITHSDIILFGIMSAMGFSFRENVILSLQGYSSIIRFPLYLIHILFTSAITYSILLAHKQQQKRYLVLTGIATAIRGHSIYNLSNRQSPIILTIILIAASYYLLSFFFYKSDAIYIGKE